MCSTEFFFGLGWLIIPLAMIALCFNVCFVMRGATTGPMRCCWGHEDTDETRHEHKGS